MNSNFNELQYEINIELLLVIMKLEMAWKNEIEALVWNTEISCFTYCFLLDCTDMAIIKLIEEDFNFYQLLLYFIYFLSHLKSLCEGKKAMCY